MIDIEVNSGNLGSKRESFYGGSPRELLMKLVKEHPELSMEENFKLFWIEACKSQEWSPDDDGWLRIFCSYWHANQYRYLIRSQPSDTTKAEKEALTELILSKTTASVLDRMMLNNKKLRDCTGLELLEHHGWVVKVGEHVIAEFGPSTKVGDVLTNEQILKFVNKP